MHAVKERRRFRGIVRRLFRIGSGDITARPFRIVQREIPVHRGSDLLLDPFERVDDPYPDPFTHFDIKTVRTFICFVGIIVIRDRKHVARRAAEREAARRTEAQKLQALLEQGGSEAAVEAAENVLRKYRPEVLRETAQP